MRDTAQTARYALEKALEAAERNDWEDALAHLGVAERAMKDAAALVGERSSS